MIDLGVSKAVFAEILFMVCCSVYSLEQKVRLEINKISGSPQVAALRITVKDSKVPVI